MIVSGKGVGTMPWCRGRHIRVASGLMLAVAMAAIGCRSGGRDTGIRVDGPRNVLFAPDPIGLATRDVPRSDWPSTMAFDEASEQIVYRERLIDIQGRSNTSEDYTFRRFHSTRTGVRRR